MTDGTEVVEAPSVIKSTNEPTTSELLPTTKTDESDEQRKRLKESETFVINDRNSLSSVLYKLSAQMSQLQRHTIELDGANSYADNLRKQLAETEQLIQQRSRKVNELQEFIKNSRLEA